MPRFRALALVLTLAALFNPSILRAADEHSHHEEELSHPETTTAPLGFSLFDAWLDPWPHADLSRRGTPFVHLFTLEPAFLDRDLILSYRFTDAPDEREAEFEAEVEWALTRRIGLLIEAPYVMLDPESGSRERGVGDTVVGGRFLLAEFDRLLLSANVALSLPTGDDDRGLGSGEVGFEPSLSLWLDLGRWITFNAQVGTEHGVESGDDALFYNAALTWSFRGPPRTATDRGNSTSGLRCRRGRPLRSRRGARCRPAR